LTSYVIKAAIADAKARSFVFEHQKTMYGGRRIAPGDEIFLFASETAGGAGLIARGVVTRAVPTPRIPGVARQTPRVDVTVRRTALATRALGREQLRAFKIWNDGRPETELNFKFYRQATDKIGGISDAAAQFLRRCFKPKARRARSRATSRVRARPR
jgi:hypothetical protein